MRFMVLVKASKDSEAGVLPAEGLHPSSKGARVRFSGATRAVIDGPFAEAEDLVAGFWLWQLKSMEEAIGWAKRIPFAAGEVEIRQVFEASDFGPALTPELREAEERQRAQAARKQKT